MLKMTSSIEETRGTESYSNWGNGVVDLAKSYYVKLNKK